MFDSDDCSCERSDRSTKTLDLHEKPLSLASNSPKLTCSGKLVFKINGDNKNADDPPSYSSIEQLSYRMRGSSAQNRHEKFRTNNIDAKLDKIPSPFSNNELNQWNNLPKRGESSYDDATKSFNLTNDKQKSEFEIKHNTLSDNVNDTANQAATNKSFQECEVNKKQSINYMQKNL
ncbi:unnamed protein product [Mytilus edulis]|uniref:Uncharacterized protein n=1 Tax=Mytilus edulis TaxID=6550 RepID=A0A8S3T5R4_MYTED|nr:unnamed protein product [Mytilus edulis]